MTSAPDHLQSAGIVGGIASNDGEHQLGWHYTESIASQLPPQIEPLKLTQPQQLLELPPCDVLWLIDSFVVTNGDPSGQLSLRFWPETGSLKDLFSWESLHDWSPLNTLLLMESLNQLPARINLALIGISESSAASPGPAESCKILEQELVHRIDEQWSEFISSASLSESNEV